MDVDIGQEFQQHPLGRLHHPVGDAGRDAHCPGGAAYPFDLALIRQLEGFELALDRTAEDDLTAAEWGRATLANFYLQTLVI